MKMCIQVDLDTTGALRHMNKNNSERPVCSTHPLAPISTSFLFVFDTEWVMSTCEHQGRDTVLQTGVKIHWSRRLLLLQPSMERDKKLCKASIDAQALGPAALTLAQPIGMD